MALNDMYNIVHDMTNLGQSTLNVYQVERTSAVESAGSISDGFQNSILPVLRAFQSSSVINNELRIFNLGESTDFGTFSIGAAAGFRVGADPPAFTAAELKFPSLDRAVRTGFKRYAGLLEADDTDGVLGGTVLALLNTLGTAIIAPWLSSIDSHAICNFVIIKRVCDVVPPPGEPCPQYRLPETGDPLVFYQPNSRIALTSTRSQVSRRPRAS